MRTPKYFWSVLLSILAISLVGCASTVSNPYKSPNEVVDVEGRGLVWVYYEAPGYIVRMKAVEVFVDGKSIGYIKANGHALLALKPGKRNVKTVMNHNYPLPSLSTTGPNFNIPVEARNQNVFRVSWDLDSFDRDVPTQIDIVKYKVPHTLSSKLPDSIYKSNQDLTFTER